MRFLVVSALFLGLSLTLALPGMLPAEAAEKINRSDLTEDRIIFTSMVLAFSLTMAPVVMLYPLSDPNDYDYDYGRADISIIAEFKYIAVTCAAKSTGDLKTRVAAAFDTCQPLSTWALDVVDPMICPPLGEIKDRDEQRSLYMDCIKTELGWTNDFNITKDMATMPEVVSEAMNSQDENSAISKCVPDIMVQLEPWVQYCGYDTEAAETINRAFLEVVCVPSTFLDACEKMLIPA